MRNIARPVLGDFAVDGDSYGVPGLEDIVEGLVKRLKAAERERDALRRLEQELRRYIVGLDFEGTVANHFRPELKALDALRAKEPPNE